MLLTIDIGNTQTAIGLFEGDDVRGHWAFTTRSEDTADEIHLNLAGLFSLSAFSLEAIEHVAIASVVPTLTSSWVEVARRITGEEPVVVGPGVKTGLPLRYDNPAEIGADRIADAVGAIALVGAPVIVVDLGTATNIEVVDRKGNFCGGIIAPGLGTGARDLASHAAKLPLVDLTLPDHVIGTNTNDAMRSGIMFGEVARIDGLVRRVFAELGYEPTVISTGGYGNVIARHSETISRHEPELTLQGLRLIYERNRN